MPIQIKSLLATALTAGLMTASVSLTAQELTIRCDPPAGSLSRLSRSQQKAFMASQDKFLAGHFADALADLRGLLAQIPPNSPAQSALAERTAEAAIEAEDRAYAISLLKPIEEHDGSDCLARVLLARADAENGQSAERDAEISALTALHKQAPESPAGKLDMFVLEKHSLKNGGSVMIYYVLRPWGPHNTHILAGVMDASGTLTLHVELDSDDGDQVYFKETHPELVAKGERRFSLDVFGQDRTLPSGKIDHPHTVVQFFDGKPSYETVHERILAIAEHGDDVQKMLPHESQ